MANNQELLLPPIPLSPEIEAIIAQVFAPADLAPMREILLEIGTRSYEKEVERLRFDILHLAHGDLARARQLANLTHKDPRDLMSAEYFRIGGRHGQSYPHPWARRHPVNRDRPYPPEEASHTPPPRGLTR